MSDFIEPYTPPEVDEAYHERVRFAVSTMPRLTRLVLILMHGRKLGADRTARRLGISKWRVRRHLSRAVEHVADVVTHHKIPR